MSQTPPSMTGVNYSQTSSPFGNNHHTEIAEIIQKLLQPSANGNNLLWNLPSGEYMSKAMTCETCRETINEVETVLICDACEKGYHLKCLEGSNMKGVPKSEWLFSRCVELYNGKSFPTKYGCATTAKMWSGTAEVKLPAETAKEAEDATAMSHTLATEDAAAMSLTVKAKDTVAMSRTVEGKDVAISRTIKAEDADMSHTLRAEYEAAMSHTLEAKDAAMSRTIKVEDAAMSLGPVW